MIKLIDIIERKEVWVVWLDSYRKIENGKQEIIAEGVFKGIYATEKLAEKMCKYFENQELADGYVQRARTHSAPIFTKAYFEEEFF